MKSFRYKVTEPEGLNFRQAGLLLKEAMQFSSSVSIDYKESMGDAKRLFSMAGLGISQGDEIVVEAEGEDEARAAVQLSAFFAQFL